MSRGYIAYGDSMFNPMREYPRNLPCPCQSGKKFKKCCYLTTPFVVRKHKDSELGAVQIKMLKKAYKNGP